MMERHVVVKGLKRFGKFLQSERSRFSAAPILLIQGKDDKREATDMACRQVEFMLSQQLGFRTVMSHSCSNAVFCTNNLVQEQQELAARTGATTVCAVGNQAAMDLAKAVVKDDASTVWDELLLVPATYEGILASAQPQHALLLDAVEDAILLVHSSSSSTSTTIPSTVAALEASNMDTSGQVNALFAVISLCLDTVYQKRSTTDCSSDIISLLTQAVEILESCDHSGGGGGDKNIHDQVVESLLAAGKLTSFGVSMDTGNRSIPLGVAASLMPQVFPNEDILCVMASLVPAFCQALTSDSGAGGNDETAAIIMDLISRVNALDVKPRSLMTTDSLDSLLSHIQHNRLLWNCLDAPDSDYHELLQNHVLV